MDSKRQNKIGRLLQKELGSIFTTDVKSLFEGAFVSVTQVKVTSDLSIARVYLSFLLSNNRDSLLENIKLKTKNIRQLLADRIKNQIRVVPALHFFIDDSADYADKMNTLISGLNIPKPNPSENENDK